MTAANEAPATGPIYAGKTTADGKLVFSELERSIFAYRRMVGHETFERAAIVVGYEALDCLRFNCEPRVASVSLLHAEAQLLGLPVEVELRLIGGIITSPGGRDWQLFAAAQGRRLARLALERFPTTSSASRQSVFHRERPDQRSLELAMVKIAERIAW